MQTRPSRCARRRPDRWDAATERNPGFVNRDLIGTVKLRVTSGQPVFVGVGPDSAVNSYLAGVAHARGDSFTTRSSDFRVYPGGAPAAPPASQTFWRASTSGSGTQTLTWNPRAGDWRIVVMNADGSAGVRSDVSIGARLPHLLTIGVIAASIGFVLLLISGGGTYLAVRPREDRR